MTIEAIRKIVSEKKIKWTTHCLEKMGERDISITDVKNGISVGEIIEDYPNDFPYPSCLIYGEAEDGRIIHIVAGTDGDTVYMITAYIPDTVIFENDLKTRRK